MNIKKIIAFVLVAVFVVPANFFPYAITVHSQTIPTTEEGIENLQKYIQQQIENSPISQEERRNLQEAARQQVTRVVDTQEDDASTQEVRKQSSLTSESSITFSVRQILEGRAEGADVSTRIEEEEEEEARKPEQQIDKVDEEEKPPKQQIETLESEKINLLAEIKELEETYRDLFVDIGPIDGSLDSVSLSLIGADATKGAEIKRQLDNKRARLLSIDKTIKKLKKLLKPRAIPRPRLGPLALPNPTKPVRTPGVKAPPKKIIKVIPGEFSLSVGIKQTEQDRRNSGRTRNEAISQALGEDHLEESEFFEKFATQVAAALLACHAAEAATKVIKKGTELVSKFTDKLKNKVKDKAEKKVKDEAKKQVSKQLGIGGDDGGGLGSSDVPTKSEDVVKALEDVEKGISKEIKKNTKETVEKTDELVEKECTLDAFAFTVKEEVKAFIIQDLLVWINSGFEGKPLFVSNPRRFFDAISDRVAGQYLENSALGFLCSPFDVSADLALSFPDAYAAGDSKSCTFSDVEDNVNNAASKLKRTVRRSADSAKLINLLKQPTINPNDVSVEDLAKHLSNPLNDYQAVLAIADGEIKTEQARVAAETKAGISQGTLGAPNPECAERQKAMGRSHLIPTICTKVQSADYVANVEKAILEQELQSINLADEVNEVLIYAAQQAAKKFITAELSRSGSGRDPSALASAVATVTSKADVVVDGVKQGAKAAIDTGNTLASLFTNARKGHMLSLVLQNLDTIKDRRTEQNLADTINTFVVGAVTPLSDSVQYDERKIFQSSESNIFAKASINSFLSSLPTEDVLLAQYGTSDYCDRAPDDIECVIRDNIVGILTDLHQTIANREIIKIFSNDPETGFRLSEDVVQLDLPNFSSQVVNRRNEIIRSTEVLSDYVENDVNLIDTTKPFLVETFFEFGFADTNSLIDSDHLSLYSDNSVGTINCPLYSGDEDLDVFPYYFETKFNKKQVVALNGFLDFDITIGKRYYRTECTLGDVTEREDAAFYTFFFKNGEENILDVTTKGSAESAGSLRYNYRHITNFLKNIDNYYR